MFSYHARVRMQQRGISEEQIDAIIRYGEEKSVNGAQSYFFSDHTGKLMKSDGYSKYLIDKCKKIYVIYRAPVVITACHTY